MADHAHDNSHIIQSLVVNLVIATAKAIAAFFTGSGAMLAETIHSFADCGNQLLLLIGVRAGQRPPDAAHPLGYGRNVYFWSFMVALLLFSGGGVFSIYEGWHKLTHLGHDEHPENVALGLGILGFSLLLEGGATLGNVREMNKRRGKKGFFQYIRETKDSDLVVVFGENSAAVLGLVFALVALSLAWITGDPRYDAFGGLAIGVVLVFVALFLAIEVKSLLVGEAADPEIVAAVTKIVDDMGSVERLLNLITIQQGPGEVLVVVKLSFNESLSVREMCTEINGFEARLRADRPECRWIFCEPDIPRS